MPMVLNWLSPTVNWLSVDAQIQPPKSHQGWESDLDMRTKGTAMPGVCTSDVDLFPQVAFPHFLQVLTDNL